MLFSPDRTVQDRRIWKTFHHHSRTFSFAARLLPRPVRLPVATLYLFCRTVDTIADDRVRDVGADRALHELDAARRHLEQTLAGRPPGSLLWQRLAEIHSTFGLLPDPLYELIDGARWDLTGKTIETRADLLHYSNLVGGSVGAMMLPFLVRRRSDMEALKAPARALGNAMQITNICRDVGEDLRRLNRMYLPRAWREEHGVPLDALRQGIRPREYAALMEAMMTTAEALYLESFETIPALRAGVRQGILGAGRMYREILNQVRDRQYDNLNHRAYVPFWRKVRIVARDDYARRKARLLAGRLPSMLEATRV